MRWTVTCGVVAVYTCLSCGDSGVDVVIEADCSGEGQVLGLSGECECIDGYIMDSNGECVLPSAGTTEESGEGGGLPSNYPFDCYPLDTSSCPPTEYCALDPTYYDFQCWHIDEEVAQLGELCDSDIAGITCAPGLVCASAFKLLLCAGSNCCATWCDVSIADACDVDVGTVCKPATFINDIPGLENLGICEVP
jgi:hypothetical protein